MPESTTMTSVDSGLRLKNAGQAILNHVISAATLHLYDLPSRHIITTGPGVFDCEQVCVSLLRVESGIGLGQNSELVQGGPNCDLGWSLVAELAIVRCAPKVSNRTGTMTPAKIEEGLEQSSKDIFILTSAVETLAESLFGGFTASLTPNVIEGSFIATTADIRMVLP